MMLIAAVPYALTAIPKLLSCSSSCAIALSMGTNHGNCAKGAKRRVKGRRRVSIIVAPPPTYLLRQVPHCREDSEVLVDGVGGRGVGDDD